MEFEQSPEGQVSSDCVEEAGTGFQRVEIVGTKALKKRECRFRCQGRKADEEGDIHSIPLTLFICLFTYHSFQLQCLDEF